MAKLVILKSLLDSYYDNMIEKSTTHKYIRRVPKSSGKGYNYFYPSDFKKPIKALLSFFGMKEETINNAYKNNNIQEAYGVTKQGFAQHVLEYLTNRKTWNTFFANKENRERYKIPEKPVKATETVKVTEKEIVGGKTTEKITVEEKETQEKNFKSTWNRSLMRKVYSMYNAIPEDKAENKPGIDSIKVGDTVSYNGRTGKVTKDFENGMVFISFENGGMGRFAVKDLQKMNVTADEVTESADENAAEQNVNGTNEAIQETVEEKIKKEPVEKPGFNATEKAVITILYEQYKKQLKDKYPDSDILNIKIGSKIIEDYPELDAHGDVRRTMMNVRGLVFDKKLIPDVVKFINDKNVKGENPLETKETDEEEHKNRSEAMMGNDNAKKLGAIEEFENGLNFKLQDETKEKLVNQMSEYTIDALNNTMAEFIRNITPFTMNNLEDSIVTMNDRIRKEKHPLIQLYNQVKRDYLISLRDKQNEQKTVETETIEKPGYTDGEKAAIALAYRKEKDFDPTMSDYAYYEKIKEKFPDLAEKGELYSTMLEVKDMMFNESRLKAAKDYLNSLINKENTQSETENVETTAETPSETKNAAIDYYVSGDGMWINKYLRNPEQFAKDGGKVSAEDKQIIAELDKETTSTPVTEKKLYRAVDASSIFGNISDGDFDDLVAHIVYGNNDKLIANKAGLLVNRAENKQITEKGFMSTTKDKEIADNWDGFTGSNKEVILELDIPDGMTGKDLAAYDVEGEEQKEVLLPRNFDYFIKKVTTNENGKILVQAQVLGPHGNHIAMLGNQNARKYGLSEEDELEYNKQYNWYKDTYVDGTRRNNPYTDEEETIEGILKDEADERFRVYGDKDIAYLALKDLYIDTTGKDYTPPAKDEPKPETEKQMKEEEKEYKKAREEAGLPKIGVNYGERISAMEDSVSLNPNDVNYAYKDTGYIAGSQKEKIQDFWKSKRESGEGTSIEEIDWNSLEENPRYAEQQITKANILGDIDYNSFREKGMDSRAAYLASRVFAAIPKEPEGRDITARKNYVIAVNTVKERLSECKTIHDVKEFIDDVYGEYKQTFDSQILRVPEVNKIKAERDELIREAEKVRNDIMEWGRNELIPKYKALGKKERKAVWRYREEIKNDVIAKIKEYDPDYSNNDIYMEIDTSNMWWPLNVSREGIYQNKFDDINTRYRAARNKAKDDIMKDNVTYETWKELGSFYDLKFSTTFQKHYNNLKAYDEKTRANPNGEINETVAYKYRDKTYDKFENWEWLNKTEKNVAKKDSEIIKGKKKRTFEMIVPKTLERKGGRNISVKSTTELKKAFNLRDVQTGTYVQSDPVSAKWHVDNLAAGFADLADVLGIKDEQISLNGRLALAVGARGHGSALAHYEPVERVINITKFKGGGSLGHEWFHSFDNMIAEAITGGNVSVYMSEPNKQTKSYRLMDAFKPNAAHDDIPDNELAQNVRAKFINLVNAMMTGDTPETETVVYNPDDVEKAKDFFENKIKFYSGYYDHDGFYTKLANAKTLDEAISAINDKFKTTVDLIRNNRDKVGKLGKYEQKRMKDTVKNYEKYRVMAAAYFDPKEAKADGGEVTVKTGRIVSRFYEDAKQMDAGKKNPYWSTPLEMAARSFEAYLCDKLKEKGQKNDYLSGHANNAEYGGEWYPYPTERDRVKINQAFDELFEVIRNENAIRKALDILDDKPWFIVKGGRFLIRK
ncbi:MAG: hypothetical protein K6E97_03665 [Treponema sp.]|nr:hypothetical protein [Treponema sp.]